MKVIGPFSELLTMNNLPASGPISDDKLEVAKDVGVLVHNGRIVEIDCFYKLTKQHSHIEELPPQSTGTPGFIDSHTHICFSGRREKDYARRLRGDTYLDIAKAGGGIQSTVQATRKATEDELLQSLLKRLSIQIKHGVTTCEVKSGYGLSIESEMKMLQTIARAQQRSPAKIVSTCLAAHTLPPEFTNKQEYLQFLTAELLPKIQHDNLTKRIDIFIEESAFSTSEAIPYLTAAKAMGFSIVIHADQFSRAGSQVAAQLNALSADHLEASEDEDFKNLKKANVIPILVPGACFGLGLPLPEARKILNHGLALVIASDWNPGSAPMGNLLLQAAVLGCQQKMTIAETFAAITYRAAKALEVEQGILTVGKVADINVFPTDNHQDILYHQGMMQPSHVFTNGENHL
ncbi:MAG: imidazolonepropionase [Oligoflexales bacterium]